jgi:hypothetical protein
MARRLASRRQNALLGALEERLYQRRRILRHLRQATRQGADVGFEQRHAAIVVRAPGPDSDGVGAGPAPLAPALTV